MPSSAEINLSADENKTSEDPAEEENTPLEPEGAVGYQQPFLPHNYASNTPQPFLISRNNHNSDLLNDNDNNNVDENSNDHQFNEYANYHRQYGQHVYVNQMQLLERRQPPTINIENHQGTASSHNPRLQNNRNAVPDEARLARRETVISHRRNYSEDFSISPEELPPLPNNRRHNNETYDRWYPRISRRTMPSEEVVRQEARQLLCNFTAEEFRLQKINLPLSIIEPTYSDPAWVSAGKDLRMLADAFSRSRERSIVRRRAQKVNMHSITMQNFFSLCSELFRGTEGISQERIVVLFTFISDIAIQQVVQGAEMVLRQLMDWSLRYIWERVCCWVREHGGWGAVLSRGANLVYHLTILTLAALSVVALGIFIRKS